MFIGDLVCKSNTCFILLSQPLFHSQDAGARVKIQVMKDQPIHIHTVANGAMMDHIIGMQQLVSIQMK